MDLTIAARTDTGLVRSNNEDGYRDRPPLLAVADGMGGPVAGEIASQVALEALDEWMAKSPGPADLPTAVLEAHRAILSRVASEPELRGMGTTMTAVWIGEATATIAHVGDSRAYLLRSGELSQLTEDQTVVQQWIEEGRLSAEEAVHHPHRNLLLQSVGGMEDDPQVEVLSVELEAGDRLLLASDGLTIHVDSLRITQVLAEASDPDTACRRLIEEAKAGGGTDNITVVVCDIGSVESTSEPLGAPEAAETPATPVPVMVSRPARSKARKTVPKATLAASLAVLVVLALVILAVPRVTAKRLYVGVDAGRVAVLRGRPGTTGGVAQGSLVKRTNVPLGVVSPPYQRRLQAGIPVGSMDEADRTIAQLPRVRGPQETPSPSPSLAPVTPAPAAVP